MTMTGELNVPRRKTGMLWTISMLAVIVAISAGAWWWMQSPTPYGVESRVVWTTSKVMGTPEAPDPFLTERIFPDLKFTKPLDIAFAPGSDRIFILQHTGQIVSFKNVPSASKADVVFDIQNIQASNKIAGNEGIEAYGLTFHPQFQTNHYCYLCYKFNFHYKQAIDYAAAYPQNKDSSRVSRFTVSDTDPPTIDPKTEQILFSWPGGGHNAGCLKFGPDGNLYIATGDNGDPNPPDPFHVGQNIGDLRSKILRIDVDHPADDKPYGIPADNPFVNTPGARGEVYAYGLRNPWRFSFDSATGNIWAGDVGWELWESVYQIQSGGNYGWSIVEGPQSVYPKGKIGPTPIIPPAVTLPHTEAASITGGVVYHGKRLGALQNQYIFGDWETRRLWAAPCDGKKLGKYRTIAQTDQRIVSFGEDAEGEIYIVDYEAGGLWRIVPNPTSGSEGNFPRKLSDTGLFSETSRQVPNPGVLPFNINAPQWVDGSTSERFIAVPSTKPVYDNDDGKRIFPPNTVLARTLSLPMTAGDAATRRKIETQLLHFDGRQWHGYTYAWDDSQSNATLVESGGRDMPLTVVDPGAPGGRRLQTWHFNSQAQCMTCHTTWTNYTLAFNEPQLQRTEQYQTPDHGLVADDQVRLFQHLNLIPLPKPPEVPKDGSPAPKPEPPVVLVDPFDEGPNHSLDDRARSYLHVNCSVCHRLGGGGTALFDVRKQMSLKETKLIWNAMLGTFNLPDAQVVCPGDPNRSVLYYRMAKMGAGHMPHLGSTMIDDRGLSLIGKWIESLRGTPGGVAATTETIQQQAEENSAMQALEGGANGAAAVAATDKLLVSTSGALKLLSAVQDGRLPASIRTIAAQHAMTSSQETIRDLFSRFVPPSENASAKLGANPNVQMLLGLSGDAERGRKVFFEAGGGICARCHIVNDKGIDFGPNLSRIGTKYGKADLLDNILHPSKSIAPEYQTWVVKSKNGDVTVGFLISETASEVVLKTPELKEVHFKMEEIEKKTSQPISAMPEGILSDFESQQAADLLEFLATRQ